MNRLVLATRNTNKVREIRQLLGDEGIVLQTLNDYPAVGEIQEQGETFEENALIKGRTVFRAVGLPTLADDSGIEVFCLDMQPGVLSARYAGPNATDRANNKRLLEELQGAPEHRREAQFHCVLAFVAGSFERVVDGTCLGTIVFEPRGANGFGYDPLFRPVGYGQTFGELPADVKNGISHRARALRKMVPILIEYFGR